MARDLRDFRKWSQRLGFERDWYLIACGAAIGTLTALGAVAFAGALHWAEHEAEALTARTSPFLLIALPIVGALLTGLLVHLFASDARGHGVPQVLEALVRKGGQIPARVGLVKVLASVCTVGSGGSAGPEGPIVQIGATVGSVFGRHIHVAREHMGTLVGCGAAAGIASVFNAPITGVFFVLEILLRDFSLRTFTPIVIASVFSTATTQAVLANDDAIFPFSRPDYVFRFVELPSYVVLGFLCAVVGVAFTRLLDASERGFAALKLHPVIKPTSGALLLGILGAAWVLRAHRMGATTDGVSPPHWPAFFGVGYQTIRDCIDPSWYQGESPSPLAPIVAVLIALTIIKALATSFTLGSGGSGGVFAPSLYLGATAGGAFGLLLELSGLLPAGATPASYAIVGMAGLIAGTTFAPLTAILLAFELSRNPLILLPVMLTSVIATVTAQLWMKDSIYTMKLRQAGILLGSGRNLTVMRRLRAESIERMAIHPEPVYASDPLSKLIQLHAYTNVPDFVVVDQSGHYIGIVTGADVRSALIDREAIPLLLVAELLRADLPTIAPDDTLDVVLEKLARPEIASLCILDPATSRPLGLVTRGNALRRYRRALEEE